jgi:hypothetical protein
MSLRTAASLRTASGHTSAGGRTAVAMVEGLDGPVAAAGCWPTTAAARIIALNMPSPSRAQGQTILGFIPSEYTADHCGHDSQGSPTGRPSPPGLPTIAGILPPSSPASGGGPHNARATVPL